MPPEGPASGPPHDPPPWVIALFTALRRETDLTARLHRLTEGQAAVADLFGIKGRFAGHPAFGRHSKSGTAFTAGDRALEERDALTAHADEIEKVEAWATVLAERAGVALTLPNPLIA